MLKTGLDIACLERFELWLNRYSNEQLAIVFSAHELRQAASAPDCSLHLAICFAAKEAMIKASTLSDGLQHLTQIETTIDGDALQTRHVVLGDKAFGAWRSLPGRQIAAALILPD
jgi:phosphopantetheine--protein transferase-like protein